MWNERKWLMVQEPKTQALRVEVFDWDRINAKELLTINLLKGLKDTMGAKTLMGRWGQTYAWSMYITVTAQGCLNNPVLFVSTLTEVKLTKVNSSEESVHQLLSYSVS